MPRYWAAGSAVQHGQVELAQPVRVAEQLDPVIPRSVTVKVKTARGWLPRDQTSPAAPSISARKWASTRTATTRG